MFEFIQSCEIAVRDAVSESALIAIPAISVAIIFPIVLFLAERNSEYVIDKNVIFRKVLNYKALTMAIILESAILVADIRILSVIASIAVIAFTSKALVLSYRWIYAFDENRSNMSFKQKMRIDYLDSLKNKKEIMENWSLILTDEKLAEKNQVGLVAAFIDAYDRLNDSDDDYSSSELIWILIKNIDKISFDNRDIYEGLLRLSLSFFDKKYKNNTITSVPYSLHDLFTKLMNISLSGKSKRTTLGYRFFREISSFSQKCDNKERFIKDFLIDFLCNLEENDADLYDVWRNDFIKDIRVTRETLNDAETSKYSLAAFEALYYYTKKRSLNFEESEWREVRILEQATEHILARCDPIFWFDIISLTEKGFPNIDGKDLYYSMILSWCKNERKYGLCGRVLSFYKDTTQDDLIIDNSNDWLTKEMRKESESEEKETCYLIGVINRWLWNDKECRKMRKAIKDIKKDGCFKKDELGYDKLIRMESHIKALQRFIKEESKQYNAA